MDHHEPPPPPPPPHGQSPRPPGGLPDGNYDIFIVPPHSAGSGFIYLPSMQGTRNGFLAGVACTLLAFGISSLLLPVVKQWFSVVNSGGGGLGVVVLVIAVGVGAWAWGRTQAKGNARGPQGGHTGGSGSGARQQDHYYGGPHSSYQAPPPPQPEQHAPPPPPPPPPPQPDSQPRARPNPSADAWEKARAETRKREEEKKRAEELKRKREEAQKAREEAEKAARAKAEKDKWEQSRAREKEQREREARERIARERLAREKEAREKDAREREAREAAEKRKAEWDKARQAEKEKSERDKIEKEKTEKEKAEKARSAPSARSSPTKSYEKPSARSQAGTEAYSYRPYDAPKAATYKSSASSISGLSESSYAASQSTARTTPPPSHRGPYSTNDPEKVQIKAVYLFSDSFPMKPISQLVSGQGNVTDGLILRITTEGLFIDDDVRGVPQREWDVKAWTLKHVEDGATRMASGKSLHVLRATIRDAENKKYTFVLDEKEAYKVAMGLQRLRKGSQVRSLGVNGIKEVELKGLLVNLGWM